MISASSGLVRSAVRPFGITLLTNFSAAPRTCGTWISSSPSPVCTRLGRLPFRQPRASGVRSYLVRPRKASTSSSTARWIASRAPSRPISASRSASNTPSTTSLSMAASNSTLGATLLFTA